MSVRPVVSTHKQRPHQRAANRSDAADDDDNKGEDQNALTHANLHSEQRPEHAAGNGAQRSADAKQTREQPPDIGAHHHGHLAV